MIGRACASVRRWWLRPTGVRWLAFVRPSARPRTLSRDRRLAGRDRVRVDADVAHFVNRVTDRCQALSATRARSTVSTTTSVDRRDRRRRLGPCRPTMVALPSTLNATRNATRNAATVAASHPKRTRSMRFAVSTDASTRHDLASLVTSLVTGRSQAPETSPGQDRPLGVRAGRAGGVAAVHPTGGETLAIGSDE